MANPVVFFDMTIGGKAQGRVIFELFEDVCPRTCKNFCQLVTGEKGDGQRLRHAGQHREPRGHAPRAPDRAHVQLEARPRHDRAEPRRADRRLVRVRQGRAAVAGTSAV